jgi:excisionase family DNA binding protein
MINPRGGDATGAGPATVVNLPDVLTVRELAAFLRIGKNQAYDLVNSGTIAACRVGTAIRVPRAAVERWMNAQDAESGAEVAS